MLAPTNIEMIPSQNPHSIANRGRVEIPGFFDTLLPLQHDYLVRGFQGIGTGCGNCGVGDISPTIGDWFNSLGSTNTLLLAVGAFGIYFLINEDIERKKEFKRRGWKE